MGKKAIVTDAIYEHPDFEGLTTHTRFLFTCMLIESDPEGRVCSDLKWMKRRFFGHEPHTTLSRLGGWLATLVDRGLCSPCPTPVNRVHGGLNYCQITNFKANNPAKGRAKGMEGKGKGNVTPPNPPTGGGSEESEIEEIVFELHGIVGGSERDILRAVKRVGHTIEDVQSWRIFLRDWGKQNSQFTHPGRACRAEVLGNKSPETSTLSLNGDGGIDEIMRNLKLGGAS